MLSLPACRACGAPLEHTFVDLGAQPLANSYLEPAQLAEVERFYPLHVRVCAACLLVQLPEVSSPESIFGDYAYFSSFSEGWLRHAETYVELMIDRLGLGPQSNVIEVASNDGYLLQYVVARGSLPSASSRRPTSHRWRRSEESPRVWSSSASRPPEG